MLHPGEVILLTHPAAILIISLSQLDQPDLREVVLDCRDARLRTRTLATRWRCLAVTYPRNINMHIPRTKTTHFELKVNIYSLLANTPIDVKTCETLLKEVFGRVRLGKDVQTNRSKNAFGVVKWLGVGPLVLPDGKNQPSITRPPGVMIAQNRLSNNKTKHSILKTYITTMY